MGWGWFGVIEIGLFLGLVFRLVDQTLTELEPTTLHLISAGVIIMYFFVSFRYLTFGYFFPIIVAVVLAQATRRRAYAAATRSVASVTSVTSVTAVTGTNAIRDI